MLRWATGNKTNKWTGEKGSQPIFSLSKRVFQHYTGHDSGLFRRYNVMWMHCILGYWGSRRWKTLSPPSTNDFCLHKSGNSHRKGGLYLCARFHLLFIHGWTQFCPQTIQAGVSCLPAQWLRSVTWNEEAAVPRSEINARHSLRFKPTMELKKKKNHPYISHWLSHMFSRLTCLDFHAKSSVSSCKFFFSRSISFHGNENDLSETLIHFDVIFYAN